MDRVSYRQLQSDAKTLKLPGNMKYQVLLDMVSARKAGNERRVEKLINEQKRLRFERRLNRKVARTLEDNNLRLAQLSTGTFNAQNNSNRPVLTGTGASRDAVIAPSGQREATQNSSAPVIQWDYARDLRMVHLLDPKTRHEVMAREIQEFRKIVQQLPLYTPKGSVNNQFSSVNRSSAPYVPNVEPIVPHSNVIHGNVNGTNLPPVIGGGLSYKRTEWSAREMKSYHIEDLIGPVPSTSHGPAYLNGHYSGEYHMQVPMPAKFARYSKMYDHEGYQLKQSAPPQQNVRSPSPGSDTQSADEIGIEMTFEDDQYMGFEPYIEEVISSQPFEPEQTDLEQTTDLVETAELETTAYLPPLHILKSEVQMIEESAGVVSEDSAKIFIEIGAETAPQKMAQVFITKQEPVASTEQGRVYCTNQGELGESGAGRGIPESIAPDALPIISEQLVINESPEPDLVGDDACDGTLSSEDGELEIVLPEDGDEAPFDFKADLLPEVGEKAPSEDFKADLLPEVGGQAPADVSIADLLKEPTGSA